MNTNEMLENLTELYAQRDLLDIDKRRAKTDAMPPEVTKALADIDAEYAPKENAVSEKITDLEARVKDAVLQAGQTAKGGSLQAVFAKGRVTWETKGLDGLIVAIPQLAQFRKTGAPSVSIRKV
jgi:phage host-nuclease inhibitor protein Gam